MQLEDRINPMTFTVTNTNDAGPGSLRQAIVDANGLAGADTVVFDAAKFATQQTITLTTAEMAISDPVTITGPLSKVVVDANKLSRHFTIDVPGKSHQPFNIANMILTNGKVAAVTGGAIHGTDEAVSLTNVMLSFSSSGAVGGAIGFAGKGAALTLTDCTVTGNSAGGNGGGAYLSTSYDLTIIRSTISNNVSMAKGGGVWASVSSFADLTILESSITGNSAGGGGGGVYSSGYFLMQNSLIAGNTASGGGGLSVGTTNSIHVENSTISGNVSLGNGGGIQLRSGIFAVENSTITGNTAQGTGGGGGISRPGSPASTGLYSTIASGNVDTSANGRPDLYIVGSLVAAKCAISSTNGVGSFVDGGGNLLGQNLKLGPLASNGGRTQTHLPAVDSPLINQGFNYTSLSTDQRGAGFPREVGGQVDIGAVELTNSTLVTSTNDFGMGSLRQAIHDANARPGLDTITFSIGTGVQTISCAEPNSGRIRCRIDAVGILAC